MSAAERTKTLARAMDALRERHEAGDRTAIMEALALLGPVQMMRSEAPEAWLCLPPLPPWGDIDQEFLEEFREFYPQMPEWLDIAVRESLYLAVRTGEDSIRRAFGITVQSGANTTIERHQAISRENRALGLRFGIRAARRDTRIPYPPGETADSLTGRMMRNARGPIPEPTVKRWCANAEARRACEIHEPEVDQAARRVYRWILVTGSYPPWSGLTDIEVWDQVARSRHRERITKRRFW